MELENSLKIAHKLADVSGEIIAKYFRQAHLQTQTKEGMVSSIVTLADLEAEAAMVEILRQEAPQDGVIREEGEDIASDSGRYWVLDPIDGTSSFAKGFPIFGTLIGLVEGDTYQTLLGIVNQPILRERWTGVLGQKTLLNQAILTNPYNLESDSQLQNACLNATTPLMFITERQRLICHRLQQVCKRQAFGGDCYNYMALASGWGTMPLVILESDLKYYDFCAIIPIIEGTGGCITDWQGRPLKKNSTEILATSNRVLLEQALSVIANL